jgi:hypothetical protein
MVPVKQLSEMAAQMGAHMLEQAGFTADFSPASLDEIDRLLSDQVEAGTLVAGGFLNPPHLGPDHGPLLRLLELGCYVGEVLRRRYGGEWFQPGPSEPGPVVWARLEFPNGSWIDPVGAMITRVEIGRSIASFGKSAVAVAEGRFGDEAVWPIDPTAGRASEARV